MAPELTPQAIRDVRFREKLRGYHPEDVDAFVANVAATVEALHRRIDELQQNMAAAPAAAAQQEPGGDVEESLRRTLILAQRTADMAIREAQEEANRLLSEAQAQHEQTLADVTATRERLLAEAHGEVEAERNQLHDEREALQRDVGALRAYVAQERERLRIYFSEQLARVQQGVPGVEAPPQTEAPARGAESHVVVDAPGLPEEPTDSSPAVTADAAAAADGSQEGESPALQDGAAQGEVADDDDPFLAELRRAVTDTEPLGPRDESDASDDSGEPFDIFNDEEGGGRFLRRRR